LQATGKTSLDYVSEISEYKFQYPQIFYVKGGIDMFIHSVDDRDKALHLPICTSGKENESFKGFVNVHYSHKDQKYLGFTKGKSLFYISLKTV